jgi:hypothetical protein
MMNATASATTSPPLAKVMAAWTNLTCTLDLACSYPGNMGPPLHDFYPPPQCPPQPPPQGQGRRKRQTKGGGGGPRGPPPPVNSDFNSSAVFLQKYMELDERDRYAIGHRLYLEPNHNPHGFRESFLA